ncbi:hypothetical protein [Endozoicomonas arenosclerae]|uniref:hypothetical protein n=1 Tax=Endozoicomonas arenosclerae TaxID=1633495 RepID=UPI0007861159|nr:hypothetical protein [Endozoicomonas arenosclerae]
MKILKKDFVEETTESYCAKGHKLSSGTAYFMRDRGGNIHYGGKQCAELHGTNNVSDVPDLTKSLVSLKQGESGTSSGASQKTTSEKNERSTAISYLLLREELLKDFSLKNRRLSFEKLKEYYNYYKENDDLTESQIKHIINIESFSKKNINSKLSLKNLSTCHAYRFILNRTFYYLEKKNNDKGIAFILSLRSHLLRKCSLTLEQIEGLKRWIQYLPNDLRNAKLRDFEYEHNK